MNLTNCLRHLRHLAFAVATAFTLAAVGAASGCAAINRLDPTIAPTPAPGQPCGPIDIVCYGQGGKVAGCCEEYDTCGGPDSVGCPANSCCDLGGGGEFSARYSPASDAASDAAAADAQPASPSPSSSRRPRHSPTPMRAPYSQAAAVFVDSPTRALGRGF
jgi:hypothetical protein